VSRHDDYESELTASRAAIAGVLSGVVDGLYGGAIELRDDSETVTVTPPETLDLEIELEVEDDEVSLELELTWPLSDDAAAAVSRRESQPNAEPTTPAAIVGPTDAQSLGRFEVFPDGDAWRWRLRHRDGRHIAISAERYPERNNAWERLLTMLQDDGRAEVVDEFV
jgi:amphi-Trp domain-containing protein